MRILEPISLCGWSGIKQPTERDNILKLILRADTEGSQNQKENHHHTFDLYNSHVVMSSYWYYLLIGTYKKKKTKINNGNLSQVLCLKMGLGEGKHIHFVKINGTEIY